MYITKLKGLTVNKAALLQTAAFFLCGQGNQRNRLKSTKCDKIKFGAQFPSEHENYDRPHQIALLYKRNLQNIAVLLLFSRDFGFENLKVRSISYDIQNSQQAMSRKPVG